MLQFVPYIYTVGIFAIDDKVAGERKIIKFLFPRGRELYLTFGYHFRKCKRPVGEENEEDKKGKRKRAAEMEIEVSKKDVAVAAVENKRKTKDHSNNHQRCDSRLPKVTTITDDYEISSHVLGLGINGKVVQCYDINTRKKYALKVR